MKAAEGGKSLPAAKCTFTGSLWEYWKICAIGLLLALVTIGAYAPWAKVRRLRYLYGHARVLGGGFDFDASPRSILASRAIAIAVVSAALIVDVGFLLLFFLLIPLGVLRARMFFARHTLYKGVRFGYVSRLRHLYFYFASFAFAVLPCFTLFLVFMVPSSEYDIGSIIIEEGMALFLFASAILAGAALPALIFAQHRILANNITFGILRLRIDTPLRRYYAVFVAGALAACMAAAAVVFIIKQAIIAVFGAPYQAYAYMVVMAAAILAYCLLRALFNKLFWSNLELSDGSRIVSRVTFRGLIAVFLTNVLITTLSLGLLWPIARARRWRYIVGSLAILPGTLLSTAVSSDRDATVNALGAEGTAIMGIDFDAGAI